ncbi:MAG: hypothetical protein R2706_18200 [Acidimicrobiales bacterium]
MTNLAQTSLRSEWRSSLVGALGAVLLVAAACSVPTDGAATPITSVPYDLLEVNAPTTEPELPASDEGGHIVPVWVLADNPTALFPVTRATEEKEPSLQDAYDALVAGPTEAELAANPGLKTKVPATLAGQLPDNPGADGILTIVVDAGYPFEQAPDKLLITAQLVCTFQFFSSVDGVRIVNTNGVEVGLTNFDTKTIDGAARASDFNNCEATKLDDPTVTSTATSEG